MITFSTTNKPIRTENKLDETEELVTSFEDEEGSQQPVLHVKVGELGVSQ